MAVGEDRASDNWELRRYSAMGSGAARRPSLRREFGVVLAGARANEPEAWRELYDWLAPGVAGYLRLLGAQEVEDLTSEVLLAVFRRIHAFAGTESNFRSWVFNVAHSRLVDERRRRYRRPEPVPLEEAEEPRVEAGDPCDVVCEALEVTGIQAICARLPDDQRAVVLLRVVADLSIEQVAAILGKSPGAVKQLQRRGFDKARRFFSQEGVTL